MLHPGLRPPAQERHGPVREDPEEGCENDRGAGTPLLGRKAEKRRLWGDLIAAFQYLKGAYKKDGERSCSGRIQGNGFKLKDHRYG